MSTTDEGASGRTSVKTLAIRLEPDLHARLSIIAQLRGNTITDEIREAIDRHIEQVRSNPDLTAKADAVLDDIEREASTRRGAIAALFGSDSDSETTSPRGKRTTKRDAPSTEGGGSASS